MRFIAVCLLGVLSATALFFIFDNGTASAFSPELRVVETEVITIEEDEGYYDDTIISRVQPLNQSVYSAGHSSHLAHDTLPGFERETARLLREMEQGPSQYLESLRAARANVGEPDEPMPEPPSSVTELPWVSDGLTDNESLTLDLLAELNRFNPSAAERIALMPFLRTFGPADLEAVWSLTIVAQIDYEEDTAALNALLDHPNLADHGGIDNMEARLVAVLGGTHYFNPELAQALLDPHQVTISNHVLPGMEHEIHMTIFRTEPGSFRTDDLVRNAVQEAEAIMDQPLRTDYVAVLIADGTLPSFAAGAHFGTHITIPPRFDTDDHSEYPGAWAGILIGHEVAHYYWFSDHPLWVDEGAADFMAGLMELRRVGRVMEPDNVPCSFYRSILHLELAQPDQGSYGGLCHYTLGERLWLDLYSYYDEESVLSTFRAFYASVTADEEAELPTEYHVMSAFLPPDLTPPDAAVRNLLLSKHYSPDINSDTRLVRPEIPALNGRVTERSAGANLQWEHCRNPLRILFNPCVQDCESAFVDTPDAVRCSAASGY